MKTLLKKIFGLAGYQLERINTQKYPINLDDGFIESLGDTNWSRYTMTTLLDMHALYQSVNYIIDNNIPGDFVECGVWRGGSMMYIAGLLEARGVTDRTLWLFDTFDGMTEPTEHDVKVTTELVPALPKWDNRKNESGGSSWAYASLEEVKENMSTIPYPTDRVRFVKGDVLRTIPETPLGDIALLRLDTDWYESTKFELETLYPKISQHGVLIIDDYGAWSGSRKATDEYFKSPRPFLHRVDKSTRIIQKQSL